MFRNLWNTPVDQLGSGRICLLGLLFYSKWLCAIHSGKAQRISTSSLWKRHKIEQDKKLGDTAIDVRENKQIKTTYAHTKILSKQEKQEKTRLNSGNIKSGSYRISVDQKGCHHDICRLHCTSQMSSPFYNEQLITVICTVYIWWSKCLCTNICFFY